MLFYQDHDIIYPTEGESMNSEVLETSKNECYVISDDSKVRRLTKVDGIRDFKTILTAENDAEILGKEKNKLKQKLDKNSEKNILVWTAVICVVALGRIVTLIIGYLGHDILLNQTLGVLLNGYIGCSLFSIIMATIYSIGNFIKKRKLRKRILDIDKHLKELSQYLEKVKTNEKVEEEVLSNSTINTDTVNLLNDAYKLDNNARKIIEENNYRVLHQYQRENNDTNIEKKGYTYSLRR